MELSTVIERIAEGLVFVDLNTRIARTSQRTKQPYLPGVKTMLEWQFVDELMDWWTRTYPSDFNPGESRVWEAQRHYSSQKTSSGVLISKDACDLILVTGSSTFTKPEWAIEIKHIALAGDNGKTNDYPIPKLLSPYKKDRSLMHDIDKLFGSSIAHKKAVVGYCFNYDMNTLLEAENRFPAEAKRGGRISNLKAVCRSVDPVRLEYSSSEIVEFTDRIFMAEKRTSPVVRRGFAGAWRHPIGGNGEVFGWQIVSVESELG
jgi:hypothetical protein